MDLIVCGESVFIDDEDYSVFTKYKWRLQKTHGTVYLVRSSWENGKCKTYLFHREIMNTIGTGCIDHVNGNGLDNRKTNLRVCSIAENCRNSKKKSNSSNKYKGVTLDKRRNKYFARIRFNWDRINLGYFNTEEEAYKAYCEAAIKYHGEYARY